MFGKLIALIILGIAIYNVYRIYERGKIRAELIKNGNKKVTHEDVVKEQQRRDEDSILSTLEKIEERKRTNQDRVIDTEIVKTIEKQFFAKKEIKQKSYKQLGDEYEEQVATYYRSLGYEVIERGKTMGRKDGGIDLIAKKESETILIQCKNWGSRAIKHSHIKEFLYNAKTFIEENNLNDEIEYLFVASNDTFDKSAKGFIYHTKEKVNFKVIPYLG